MLRAREVTVLEYTRKHAHNLCAHKNQHSAYFASAQVSFGARSRVCVDCTEVLEIISLNVSTCMCVCRAIGFLFVLSQAGHTHHHACVVVRCSVVR